MKGIRRRGQEFIATRIRPTPIRHELETCISCENLSAITCPAEQEPGVSSTTVATKKRG